MPDRLTQKSLHRIIDANYNRAKEGLRVCEDIARFIMDDKPLSAGFKRARHALAGAITLLGLKQIICARNILEDVGKNTVPSEQKRSSVDELVYANAQRVKESLRVLEEFAKLENTKAAETCKQLRYKVYELEKKMLGRL